MNRAFFGRDARVVAPELLGATLRAGTRAGRIVEVEAYVGAEDPAAHSFRGPTPRTEVMFGPPGRLYVYFIYGVHWCANVVCGPPGVGNAVLVRALEPVDGLDEMYAARGPAARRPRDLCSGPAKLCQALGIDGSLDGVDLVVGDPSVSIEAGPAPSAVTQTTRVGLSVATDLPWRWYETGNPHVSRP